MKAQLAIVLAISVVLTFAPSAHAQQTGWSTKKKVAVGVGAAAAAAGAGYLIYRNYKKGKENEALQGQLDEQQRQLDELRTQERVRLAAEEAARRQREHDEQVAKDAREAEKVAEENRKADALAAQRARQRAAAYARAVAEATPVYSFDSKSYNKTCSSTNPVSHAKKEVDLAKCGFDGTGATEIAYRPEASISKAAKAELFKAMQAQKLAGDVSPAKKIALLRRLVEGKQDKSEGYCTARKIETSSTNPAWKIEGDSTVEQKIELCGYKLSRVEFVLSEEGGLQSCRARSTYVAGEFSKVDESYAKIEECGLAYCGGVGCDRGRLYKAVAASNVFDANAYSHTNDDRVLSSTRQVAPTCQSITIHEARLQIEGHDELSRPFQYSVIRPESDASQCGAPVVAVEPVKQEGESGPKQVPAVSDASTQTLAADNGKSSTPAN